MALRHPLVRILAGAALMALAGSALGLLANALHPMGLPLTLREVRGPAIPVWIWRAVRQVDAAEARRLWAAQAVVVLDARNSGDYAQDHIPGSLSLPYWELSSAYPAVAARLPHDRPLLITCYGSECGLSMRLAKRLLADGYRDLIVLRGGIAAWEAAGYPLTGPEGRLP